MPSAPTSASDCLPAATSVLRVENLSKTFGPTCVLRGLDFEVGAGQVHGLVGQNGSGKSTFIKLLSGYHDADPGSRYWYEGTEVPGDEISRRLRFVHQNLGLVPELSAVENLALRQALPGGNARRRQRRSAEISAARELLERLGLPDLDVAVPLASASIVERTIVAIAGALAGWGSSRAGVLVLDEPTAVMPPREARRLLDVVRDLRDAGTGIIYVSHRLDEVFEVCDRVTILRNGDRVAVRDVTDLDQPELVRLMVGSNVDPDRKFTAEVSPATSKRVLDVEGLTGRWLRGVDFSIQAGEVVGIAGLPDAGRDELPRLITDQSSSATGGRLRSATDEDWSPVRKWRSRKTVLLPPDRAREGLVAEMSGIENLTLSTVGSLSRASIVDTKLEADVVAHWAADLEVVGLMTNPVSTMSGGNQQKVLLARCLAMQPDVLVICEPTAGVDVGARQAIYAFIAREAARGLAVIVASSDVSDILALCTRVIALRDGLVDGELRHDQIQEQALVSAMEGMGVNPVPSPENRERA